MLSAAIVWIGLGVVGSGLGDFLRPFGSRDFDQATFDAESFGDKKALSRAEDGLKVVLAPGAAEVGWKTPQALRIGGDCSVSASLSILKLPKPGGEDGVAIGLAVATQNVDQPEATLLRQVEPDGKPIFRSVDKGGNAAPGGIGRMMPGMMMPFGFGPPGKPAKPERRTFPAQGTNIRLEIRRQGSTLRYQVFDEVAGEPREIGHFEIGSGDIAGVKLFVSNRNGAEAVEVLLRDITIHADRLSGLGTAVRTIFGTVLHGDPTKLDGATLSIGGTPPQPPPSTEPKPQPTTMPAAPARPTAEPTAAVPGAMVPAVVAPAAVVAPPAGGAAQLTIKVDQAQGVAPPAAPTPPAGGAAAATSPAAAAPPKEVSLAEVETITFERSSTLSARYLGQPNVDATRPGGPDATKDKDQDKDKDKKPEPAAPKPPTGDDLAAPPPGTVAPVKIAKVEAKPNGIRDIHLGLSSLRPAALKQVMIQCPTDKGQASWQLDTTGSANWPLTLTRAGSEPYADLFLEPPVGDCHDKEFTITLNYADGQQANTKVKATGHTDPKLAIDPQSPSPALDARVFLAGDEQLFGKLEAIGDDKLTLTTPWGDRLDLPMTRIVGVYMGMPDHKESAESFAKRLKTRGDQDTLLARAKDGEVVAITGVVESIHANKLGFQYGGKTRTLPLKGVEGMILAARPALPPPTEVRPTFDLAGGIVISGRWKAIEATVWEVETPWGQTVKLPATDVRSVRVRGGGMTYLSDLEPSQVEEIPYFGRRTPYRKDVSLTGAPLRLDGQAIDKGLAVHSRTSLTYDLNHRFATFEALVGFDESGGKKGRVDCRVFADGKEIYANPDLHADASATRLSLPVAGAEQLRLVIDFGADENTGDRVIWGNARLYRQPPAPSPTPPVTTSIPQPASGP